MNSLDVAVQKLDKAFNNKAINEVMDFYENDAILVMEPGRVAKGHAEISDFFKTVFQMNIKARQVITHVLETGDIALFTSKWIAEGSLPNGEAFLNENIATSVFRKGKDNKWRLVIDNSFGPEVLNN